jgi:polysaccharide export outer membrane protein
MQNCILRLFFVGTLIVTVGLPPGGFNAVALQGSYKVGRMDVIKVEVAGDPEFTAEATVSDKGTISYGILGELRVENLTVSEITELIQKELVRRKLLTQPTVTVVVKTYRSQSVTILGEVRTPGKYYLQGPEKLVDVIAGAGGITPNAGDIIINRTRPMEPEIITIKSSALLSDTTPLESGDVILVRTREISQVFVSGEVMAGKPMTYVEGLTVSQAILMAGGLNRFGSKKAITIRRREDGKEAIVKVNLSDIEKGKAKDIPLMPNDQIFVGRRIF